MTLIRTPADEAEARAVQDELRTRVVLDEPGPPPGTGLVTGVDVAYDDEHDVVVAAAVVRAPPPPRGGGGCPAGRRGAVPNRPGRRPVPEIPAGVAA
ncbi:endonuclease V, partial [Streptomyces sp. NPDC059016]